MRKLSSNISHDFNDFGSYNAPEIFVTNQKLKKKIGLVGGRYGSVIFIHSRFG